MAWSSEDIELWIAEKIEQVVDMVDQWLQNHIYHIDIHLKRCVSK